MKLIEISADYPIVIDLVNKWCAKRESVYIDVPEIGRCQVEKISPRLRLRGYDVIYAYPGENPFDTNTPTESISAKPDQLENAELEKLPDGSWLLVIPEQLPKP